MAVIPSTNVNLATNICDVLNAAGGSVGSDGNVASFFTSEAKINKWAKFKPVICSNQPFLDDDRRWQGDTGLCGFASDSIVFGSAAELVSAYISGSTFVYEIPSGGTKEPMRLGDFRLYYTDAKAPILSFGYTGQMASNDSSSSSTFTILGNGDIDTAYNLRMSDILPDGATALAEYYFGIIIVNSSGSVVLTKSSGTGIGTSASFTQNITVKQTEVGSAGVYTAYPMFTNSGGNRFIACPIASITFQIVTSVDADKVGFVDQSGTYTIGSKFTVAAQIAYSKSFGNTSVRITPVVTHSNGLTEELAAYESVTLPSITNDTGYYNYSRTLQMQSIQTGDVFKLVMYYGSNFGNIATIRLDNPDDL